MAFCQIIWLFSNLNVWSLRRTDGSSREEQIIQKEQILAELQRVERELQEKAHAQRMLTSTTTSEAIATPSLDTADQIRAMEDMVHLSLNNVVAAAAAASPMTSAASVVRNVTNLANLPPSERPKAKPSRKIVSNQAANNNNNAANAIVAEKGKKCQLQVKFPWIIVVFRVLDIIYRFYNLGF